MKKTIFFALLLIWNFYAAGQARFGLTGGALLAKTSAPGSNVPGGYFGVAMDFKAGKSVSFMPQLKYAIKGEKSAGNDKGQYNYFELPLNFVYNIPTDIGRFSIGGGPALAYMVSGSWTAQGASKEKIYFKYDKVNQLDYGLNLQAAFELEGGFFFTANYTLGLGNVWQADNIGSNKNRATGLGIGIMF